MHLLIRPTAGICYGNHAAALLALPLGYRDVAGLQTASRWLLVD